MTAPNSGVCRSCDRLFRLTKAGMIWPHGDGETFPPARCEGAGKPPKEAR